MRLSHFIGLFLLAGLMSSCWAQLRVKNRGGCMVIYLRDTHHDSPVEADCDAIPVVKFASGQSYQEVYSWVPAFLAYSFDQAERAACGFIGCATDKTQVTLFVLANGIPNATVSEGSGFMTLSFNTGLVDFIDAASRSYWADVEDSLAQKPLTRGYADWMSSMRNLGVSCQPHVKFPTPTVSQQDFLKAQTIAQATYQFVFGHELAHYMSTSFGACGGKPPGLGREMACDKISVSSLLQMKNTTMFPGGVVAVLMALDMYSRVAGPAQFGIFGGGQAATIAQEAIASMPWNTRAKQVVDVWDQFCRSGADSKVCPVPFDDIVMDARDLAETPPPTSCTP